MRPIRNSIEFVPVCAALALGVLSAGGRAAEVEAINPQTPWRAYLMHGGLPTRQDGTLKIRQRHRAEPFDPADFDAVKDKFSPPPPADWIKPDFDASCWPRYHRDDLADFLGDYGPTVSSGAGPVLLCLRTGFGVADPRRATDLKVTVTCLGGGVVYVNGQEVGRAFMPKGAMHLLTPAEDYPIQAYTTDDGKTPLPGLSLTEKPDAKWLSRYERRVRTFTVGVPPGVLVKGRNVLAVELHAAPLAGPLDRRRAWGHLGFHDVKVTGGQGVIAYADALRGPRVWSAATVDQVAESIPEKSLIKRSWFWCLVWSRAMPIKGVHAGNPFDPLLPVKLAAPRNGVSSGQVVLSDPAGLRGVTAAVGKLVGPGQAVLPADAVRIRFAAQHEGVHYCDALMDAPPDGAATVPVWLIVQVPKRQAPGWYAGPLILRAGGKEFTVPVRVLVTGLTLPDAKDLTATISLVHSPETLAIHYDVEPWSDAHFKLMDRSLKLMGQVGNDVCYVPVILGGAKGSAKSSVRSSARIEWRMPMIRWVRTDAGLAAEFSLLEKYLDAYLKHCAPPKALSLYIWEPACAKEIADAYEGRRIPSRAHTPKAPLRVVVWDPKAKTTSEIDAPLIGEPGGEEFWKTMLEGVRRIVKERGWPERIIMLGLGGDIRPGQKTGELMRRWAPYARWNLLSHFSGDPRPQDGKLIATGGLEIGLKEWPWMAFGGAYPAQYYEKRAEEPLDFIELPTARWHWQEYCPPLIFRTIPLQWGRVGRVGLDFWLPRGKGPSNASFFSNMNKITVAGPDGAVPTVRFQMFREAVQDFEVRMAVIRACAKLPDEQRRPYRALLDELGRRIALGNYLSQNELAYDWPAYVVRVQLAAAELAGAKTDAAWANPPK